MTLEPILSRRNGLGAILVAVVTFLPFVRGLGQGRCLYFRDLSLSFFPPRLYAAEGIRDGVLRYWNPFIHEGVPGSLPPLSYPVDLLQAVNPGEWWLSLLLALHVPLGALAFLHFCRRALGLGMTSAAVGAIVYALGGFSLSAINLYVYAQAMAWAPLVVLGLLRSAEVGRSAWALAAAAVALAISTTGIEVVLQSLVLGAVCAVPCSGPRRLLRIVPPIALGAMLAAPTIVFMGQLVAGTARQEGFTTEVVLAHSVHPLTLVQTVIGSWHGDLANLTGRWWGENFFPRGFPYILSLYLGVVVFALSAVGALSGTRWRRRLAALLLIALAVSLGRWAGWSWLVDSFPVFHKLRYPVKAFFTVHFVAALLAAQGAEILGRDRTAARRFAVVVFALGGGLVALGALPLVAPGATVWFLSGFLPPGEAWPLQLSQLQLILQDARVGGLLALVAGAVVVLGLRGRLAPRATALAVAAIVSVDLVRSGAGLNPMVTSSFYLPSHGMAAEVARMKRQGGRVFTCSVETSRAYHEARNRRSNHDAFTFSTLFETLTPYYNMGQRISTAYSQDLTMLTPVGRVFAPEEGDCHDFGRLVARLREAAVRHVVSIDPLDHPALILRNTRTPLRIAPLTVHAYELTDVPPEWSVVAHAERPGDPGGGTIVGAALLAGDDSGDVRFDVEARQAGRLVVRRGHAAGWRATVDGVPAILESGEDKRRQEVPVPAGRCRVRLLYSPPYQAHAWGLAGLTGAGLLWLHRRRSA